MKNVLICGAMVAAIGVLMALTPQDSAEQQAAQLRIQVANLNLRLAEVEHANGGSPTPKSLSGDSSAQASPVRSMILVSVSQSDHADDHSKEIAQLKRKNGSLMNTVDQYAAQAASDAGQDVGVTASGAGVRGWGAAAGTRSVSTNVGAIGRQVIGDRQMQNRYATEAYITREKLHKLQASAAVPKQILHGHDEKKRVYTLDSKVDLSEALNDIAIGDTVTWKGTRLEASETAETWRITKIMKVK